MGELRLRVLGAFEVEGVDALHLGARKARTLLKVLALARGRPVGVDRLVDCLWPTEPPARPAVQVAVLVSRLRSVLGAERLVRSDAGYGRYRAKPTRRAYIPKADGRLRPLGIAALEDKILQRAVVEVLNAIYEEDFLSFSYGFRPGRSPHDALDALAVGILRKKVNWVVRRDKPARRRR